MKFNYIITIFFLLSSYINDLSAMDNGDEEPNCWKDKITIPVFKKSVEGSKEELDFAIKSRQEHNGHQCPFYVTYNGMVNTLTRMDTVKPKCLTTDQTDSCAPPPPPITITGSSSPLRNQNYPTLDNKTLLEPEKVMGIRKPDHVAPNTRICSADNLSDHLQTNSFFLEMLQNQGNLNRKLIENGLNDPMNPDYQLDPIAYKEMFIRNEARKELDSNSERLPLKSFIEKWLGIDWWEETGKKAEKKYNVITGKTDAISGYEEGACALSALPSNLSNACTPSVNSEIQKWGALILVLLQEMPNEDQYEQQVKFSIIDKAGHCSDCGEAVPETERNNHIRLHIGPDTTLPNGIQKLSKPVLDTMFNNLPEETQKLAHILHGE